MPHKNKEVRKQYQKKYNQKYYINNSEEIKNKSRKNVYKRVYNISTEDYDNLLANQNGGCAICGTDKPGGNGRFHVDHCHDTKKVRGLLCASCNLGLGNFKDDIKVFTKAIRYLKNSGKTFPTN